MRQFLYVSPQGSEICISSLSTLTQFVSALIEKKNIAKLNKSDIKEVILFEGLATVNKQGLTFRGDLARLSDFSYFVICSYLVSELNNGSSLYYIIDREKDLRQNIDFCANVFLPDTIRDNAQYLYQQGFNSSGVFGQTFYRGNNELYSEVCILRGEQSVSYYLDDSNNYTTVGEGEEHRLHKNPKLILSLIQKEKKDNEEYLYYSNSCWVELEVYKDGDLDCDNSVYESVNEAIGGFREESQVLFLSNENNKKEEK